MFANIIHLDMKNNFYYININDNDTLGLICVSLVENEAVQSKFIHFDSQEPVALTLSKDENHRTVSGIALRADYPILRLDEHGEPYYVIFTKDVIEKMVKRYAQNNLMNQVSLQHNGKLVEGIYLYESYIIDKSRGICPEEFANIENGSWIVSYYVENDEIWDEIINGHSLQGFSVECLVNLQPNKFEEQLPKEDTIDNLINSFFEDK